MTVLIICAGAVAFATVVFQIFVSLLAEEAAPLFYRFWTSSRGEGLRYGILSLVSLVAAAGLGVMGMSETNQERNALWVFGVLGLLGAVIAGVASYRRLSSVRR
jgi:hypothetical protein